jgi:hypothetical protein
MYESDSSLETIKKHAKEALAIPIGANNFDSSLWDRANRLVCNVEYIIRLPELAKSSMQIDRFCLIAATYFSEAGLAYHFASRKHLGNFHNLGVKGDGLLHDCTEIVSERLADVIKQDRIDKINGIIIEAGSNFAKKPEAMILSDARNLDDMGAAGLFHEFQRYTFVGKGVADALQLWKRKVDYRYWQARLKESFRFESVRKLAERRLSAVEYFMNQLNIETEASDLEELSAEAPKA